MIRILENFPDDVLAISGIGNVTAEDYRGTIQPALRAKRARYGKISLYYELGPEFTGMTLRAAWEDTKTDLGNWSAWRRIALVSDARWIMRGIRRIIELFHKRVRFFPTGQADVARDWILEGSALPPTGGATMSGVPGRMSSPPSTSL